MSVREKTAARALIQTSHTGADIHLQESQSLGFPVHHLPAEG